MTRLPAPLPAAAALTPAKGNPGALTYDAAFAHMANYWNQRLAVTPTLSLPNVSLANTNNLKDPGTAIDNAYKAAFIYTRIVQVGDAPFSGANNYAYLLNHDLPGILANRFEEGDFTDAQSLLLNGRISEASSFNELGANWYWDGPWRTPVAPGLESSTAKDGSYDYQTVLYVGRGVPDAWITPGQAIAVNNLTTSYNENSGQRQTYGVRIATTSLAGSRVVQVSLSGHLPGNDVQVQLPVFADAGVRGVIGGSHDAATRTVTCTATRSSSRSASRPSRPSRCRLRAPCQARTPSPR